MMNLLRIASPVLLAVGLAACSLDQRAPGGSGDAIARGQDDAEAAQWSVPVADEKSAARLWKSPADDRGYRYLTLDNGMEVLLISDPDTDKSAASLSVDVGSFDNPEDRAGLVHFLEHMLFLGTDKYPEAGEYQAFINEHGGSFNAYTSLEETNYFFDIDSGHLVPAVDRFSRFFVAPLFNPEYVDRERHAVESEYRLKIKDDSRREWDVLRELANPEHPFSKFTVGNLETLANPEDDPVREDLVAFYEKHYVAPEMKLVVLGHQSLDELQQVVAKRFGEVPSGSVDRDAETPALFEQLLPFRVNIRPEKNVRHLSFNFPVPSARDKWRNKPLAYLGHMLGHEGEGSLLASLKRRGLAEGLTAGLVFDSRYGALFSVTLALTPEGVAQQENVRDDFFAWLDLIKEEGIEAWRYREVAKLGRQAFRFQQEQPPADYVRQLSSQLHHVAPSEVLRNRHLYADFDREILERYAGHLTEDNAAMVLMAPEVETERTTELYNAPYKVESLAAASLARAAAAERDRFGLPEPNPYIAEDLSLLEGEGADKPGLLEGESNLWYYPDSRFDTPKGEFRARIALPGMDNLERTVLLEYLLAVVDDQLSAATYSATLAGLNYRLAPWSQGFDLYLSGYSDKQPVLLQTVLDALHHPDWSAERLQRVRDSLVRRWRNTRQEWPLRQLFHRVEPLLRDTWTPVEKADALADMESEQLKAFHGALFGAGEGRFYAGGNLERQQSRAMVQTVRETLELNPGDTLASYRVRNLVERDPLATVAAHVEHPDSAAVLFLQGQEPTLRERALMTLLQNIAQSPFYHALRTEQQLGYAVGSSFSPMNRVPGLMFYVQSPNTDAPGLRDAMQGFLEAFDGEISELEPGDLERHRNAVLADIEQKPRNLGELASRHLESLNLGFEGFDFRERYAEEVETVTLEQVQDAWSRLVLGERAGFWLMTSDDPGAGLGTRLPGELVEGVFRFPGAGPLPEK